ncbi:dnaJ homolog subfamily C member 16-like [Lineus longissimus]|uniref:dnaJ homolog subfamily C member 16-like n=1 Tax=Lineus longissimus TaxID=88925 RepID=UPI002B4D2AA5
MNFQNCSIIVLFVAYFSISVIVTQQGDDLYATLGVDRTSTTREIKKAYKNLARIWHPDKNKDPGANDQFTKINEAYETLTDPNKRKEYDNFGYVRMETGNAQEYRRQSFNQFHDMFGRSGFNFKFGGESFNKYQITFRSYRMNVKPESYHKPYLIYIYADLCMRCMQLESLWEKMVDDLEIVGLGLGTFNYHQDGNLANEMGIHTYPLFVSVNQGKISYFRGDYSVPSLRSFVRGFFPKNRVVRVNDENYEEFLQGWSDNKMRAIMFGHQDAQPLRYLAAAQKFRERIAFAYVKLGSLSRGMERKFGLRTYKETILMFNEDTGSPAAVVSMSKLTRSTIDDLLQSNKYLILPRLSSQEIFSDLCPIEPSRNLRKFCVVLLTKNAPEHMATRTRFREYASNFRNSYGHSFSHQVQFAYVYEDTQTDFKKKLTKQSEKNDSFLAVVILWRHSSKHIDYDWLENGWPKDDPDKIPSTEAMLDRTLEGLVRNRKVLQLTANLPEFIDEHANILIVRVWYKMLDLLDNSFSIFRYFDQVTVIYGLLTVFFVSFFGYIMHMLMVMEESKIEDANGGPKKRKPTSTSSSTAPSTQGEKKDDATLFLRELRGETFVPLIQKAAPGTLCLCILVSEETKHKLLQKFAKIVWPYSRYKALNFSFLMVDRYIGWYKRLLEETIDFRRNLDGIVTRNVIGTVVAINGHRKYFCMYHAKHQARKRKKAQGPLSGFIGMDETDSEDDGFSVLHEPEVTLFEEDLLLGLGDWFDRLYEGSLQRLRVDEWPVL